MGKVLDRFGAPRRVIGKPMKDPISAEEQQQFIVSDYAVRIKSAREKKGLPQKEFAMQLTLKESLLHKMESGHHEPDIALARKLEKLLGIQLVEVIGEGPKPIERAPVKKEHGKSVPAKNAPLTIGDIIQLKGKNI